MATELIETATNPFALLQSAIERGLDADQIGAILDLQRDWQRDRAAEAFAEALRRFQEEMPQIGKTRPVHFDGKNGQKELAYKFAAFEDIMRVARPFLNASKIVVTFFTETPEGGGQLKVTCRIRVGIHYEDHSLVFPVPKMNVNATQIFGAAVKYGQRYTLCAALNIVVCDEDNDAGRLIGVIEPEQAAEIEDLIATIPFFASQKNLDRLMKWAEVESWDELPKAAFPKVMAELKRKKGGAK